MTPPRKQVACSVEVSTLSSSLVRAKLDVAKLSYKVSIRSPKSGRNTKEQLLLPCHLPGDKKLLHLCTQRLASLISSS